MKKIICLLFIPVFIIPSIIFAQLANTTYITPYLGISNPTNHSLYRTSYNAGVNVEFAVNKLTALGFDINFANSYSRKNEIELAVMGYKLYDYGSLKTMGAMVFFKIQNSEAVRLAVQPFVKLGIGASVIAKTGINYTSYGRVTTLPDETSAGFLIAPSLGMNFPIDVKNKIVLETQFRINKSSLYNVNTFLVSLGYSFRM